MNPSSGDDSAKNGLIQCLRSPRERLGHYVILPRLIDKGRLRASGLLPPEYHANLLRLPDPSSSFFPLDGRFLEFTGLDPGALEQAILEAHDDQTVLQWVASHGRPHSSEEIRAWERSFESLPPDDRRTAHRKKTYPELAHRPDIGTLPPFDLIDLDEGRHGS